MQVWSFGRDPAIVILSEMENHTASMLSAREYLSISLCRAGEIKCSITQRAFAA
jgi:hypothetical protein